MNSGNERKNYKKRITVSAHAGMASGVSKYRHSYKLSKRVIAFVLALTMVLGLVYVDGRKRAAKADGETAIAFDDTNSKSESRASDASQIADDTYMGRFTPEEWNSNSVEIHIPEKNIAFKLASPVTETPDADTKVHYYWASQDISAAMVDDATGAVALTELGSISYDDSEGANNTYYYNKN